MTKEHYIEQILGMSDIPMFLIAFAFGLLGIFFSLLAHSSKRNVNSESTPVRFSWSFLLLDNLQRIAYSLLLLFIGIRFSPEILGKEVTVWVAFGIGLGLDQISQTLKNITLSARK